MNILVLNYEFPPIGGGGAPVSKDLSKEFVKQGNQVTVVTMGYGDLPAKEVVDGIKVNRVKCLRTKVFVCHPWEQLTYLVSAYFFIKKMMKHEKFDIVHAHFIIPTAVLAWWIKKEYGIKYVITAHGSDVMGYNQKRFKILHRLLLAPWKEIVREAEVVVSPSEYLKNLMKKIIPTHKYEIIPNGVDTKLFRPLSKEKIILVMCRLQETKGVQTVLKAIANIVEMDGWMLYIAGDGPYANELRNLVKELGIEDRVRFLGWIQNKSEEHAKLVGGSAIYVSASRFENSPISVLEALSAGCLPILSNIPPHKLLVNSEKNLFAVGDEKELSRKMISAMQSFDASNIQDTYRPEDWKEVAEKYLKVFRKCI